MVFTFAFFVGLPLLIASAKRIINKRHRPAQFAPNGVENEAEIERIVQVMDELAKMEVISKSGNLNYSSVKVRKKGKVSHPISKHVDVIFVITMPERKAYIKDVMINHYGISADKLVIVHAVEASFIHNKPILKKLYDRNILRSKKDILKFNTINEMACTMSHFSALYQIFANNSIERALIFEDDIAPQSNVSDLFRKFDDVMVRLDEIDSDWEWINFGRCFDDCKHQKVFGTVDNVKIVQSSHAQCTSSYAMTANGVKTLLNAPYSVNGWKMFPLGIVDHLIPGIFKEAPGQHHYATSPRLFDQDHKKFSSNVVANRPANFPECR